MPSGDNGLQTRNEEIVNRNKRRFLDLTFSLSYSARLNKFTLEPFVSITMNMLHSYDGYSLSNNNVPAIIDKKSMSIKPQYSGGVDFSYKINNNFSFMSRLSLSRRPILNDTEKEDLWTPSISGGASYNF